MVRGVPNQSPEFEDLVLKEIHSETREQILRLREDVTSQQYRDYLAKPENQDLINQTTQMSFAQRVQLREILIIAKLWLIQGSERDFVRVNESIADMQSDVDTGFLDENGDFREGVLPFFNRLNVTENADFRTSNGRSLNQFPTSSVSRIESVDLDFSVQPFINFQYETFEGELQNTKFLRVKNAYDSQGNLIEVRNVYVNVSSLQSFYSIEKFQSWYDFSQENLSNMIETRLDRGHIHFFRDSLDMIKERLEPTKFRELTTKLKQLIESKINDDSLYLLNNLSIVDKVYGEQSHAKCTNIVKKALTMDLGYYFVLPHLSSINQYCGSDICKKIIRRAIDDDNYEALISNLSSIKDVYEYNGISKCKEIIDKAFDQNEYSSLLRNLSTINDIYGEFGFFKCNEILESLIVDDEYDILLSNLSLIKDVYGDNGISKCDEIVNAAIEDKNYLSLLSKLREIKTIFGLQGLQQCNKIVDSAIVDKDYFSLLREITIIKELFGPQGEQKCKKIVNLLIVNKKHRYLVFHLTEIKEVFGTQGEQKCKDIVDRAMNQNEYTSLLHNLEVIKEVFGPQGEQKCKDIVDRAINQKEYAILLHNLEVIKEVLGMQGLQQCKEIVNLAISENKYNVLLDKLRVIKEAFGTQGEQKCQDVVNRAVNQKQYSSLLPNLRVIKEVLGMQGLEQCKKIVDLAIADKAYLILIDELSIIKNVYEDRGLVECERIINVIMTENKFECIFLNLKNIKSLFEGSNINILDSIVQSAYTQQQFMLLFVFKNITYTFLTNDQKIELADQCLRLNFNDLSYLMSYKRSEITEIILNNLDDFIENNLEVFKSLITLESTFALSLLEHLDVLDSTLDSELLNVLESVIKVILVSGNVNELFEHYTQLSELYPRLKDLILEDYIVLLEHYEDIPEEVSIDIISTCLDIALIKRDYATLLTYIQLPEFRFFVTHMSADDDTGIINTLRNIEVPIGAEIFNTPEGFEIVEHECEFDDDHRITDMTVRILRYGHDLQLRDEITNIENDCLELQELGINYYNHLVRPYAYLRNVIDSRAAFERRDRTFFENKRFNVTFYPKSDHNGAFNKPVSRYDKDQNNLYFEISSEREFFDTMLELEEFGIHINLLEIGGHGSQDSLSFGGEDSRLYDTSLEPDELQLCLEDEEDLRNLGELEVLRGSDILLDSCSNAKTKLASNQQLKMSSSFINMARMICGTIGCNSRVIASREPSSEINIKYRLSQYHYGFDDKTIFTQDNRPS